mgnify:CR=1 FL=1
MWEFLEEGEEFGGLGGGVEGNWGAGVDVEVGEGGPELDGLEEVATVAALEDVGVDHADEVGAREAVGGSFAYGGAG